MLTAQKLREMADEAKKISMDASDRTWDTFLTRDARAQAAQDFERYAGRASAFRMVAELIEREGITDEDH